jgi:hypothetical protein
MENWVAPKYFATIGTPFLAGRDFNSQDQGQSRVAIINQAMAHYYFGHRSPIGMHVTFDGDDQPHEIVGVVGDAKYMEMREPVWRTIYLNTFQERSVASQFALRTSRDPATVAPDVRRAVRDVLTTVSVGRVTTLEDQVDQSIVLEHLTALLSGSFGALGAVLTAIGLYGLLAYTVARRTNEIGVRMALGATRSDVSWMVLDDALLTVLAGLVIGAPIAYWGRTFAASLIPNLPVASAIPISFGLLAMIVVSLVAAYVPARRATRDGRAPGRDRLETRLYGCPPSIRRRRDHDSRLPSCRARATSDHHSGACPHRRRNSSIWRSHARSAAPSCGDAPLSQRAGQERVPGCRSNHPTLKNGKKGPEAASRLVGSTFQHGGLTPSRAGCDGRSRMTCSSVTNSATSVWSMNDSG